MRARRRSEAHVDAAFFTSLSVESFRCFGPKQRLDLTDAQGEPAKWTLILGENGTGKTTLLQCLAGMKPRWFGDGVEPWMASDRTWMELFENGRFTAEYTSAEDHGRETFHLAVEAISRSSSRSLPHTSRCHIHLAAYGATRRISASGLSTEVESDPTASLFDVEAPLINPEEWMLRLDYQALREKDVGSTRDRLEQVRDLLVAILPDVEAIHIRPPPDLAGASLAGSVRFSTPYGEVPLQGLGLGYQTMIAWVVDFAARLIARHPDSPDPLAEPAVALVDEVDLHLHPRWQRQLVGFLTARFPNTQFITTAHSPLIAQASIDTNLVLVRRDGDHVVIENDPAIVRNWRVDQVLTSDLFGLEDVRPPTTEAARAERVKLLSKPRLTTADKRRLAAIEAEIGPVPTAETASDEEAMSIIRRAAEALRNKSRKP